MLRPISRGRPPSGRARQVEAICRRCPHWSSHRGHDDATRLLVRVFASPVPPRLVSPRRTERSAAPPLSPRARRRSARSPPQKRCLQPAQSSATTSSCSSPSPRSQSTLGEAVFSISAPWHHCRRELRRAPTCSPPHLALLHLAHCFPTISSTSFTLL